MVDESTRFFRKILSHLSDDEDYNENSASSKKGTPNTSSLVSFEKLNDLVLILALKGK